MPIVPHPFEAEEKWNKNLFGFFASLCIIFHSKHVQIILHRLCLKTSHCLFASLQRYVKSANAIATVGKTPISGNLHVTAMHCSYTLAEPNLVICRLAKCESRLENSFCNASSESSAWGDRRTGEGELLLGASVCFALPLHPYINTFVNYIYIYRRTGVEGLCAFLLLQTFHCPLPLIWTLCDFPSMCCKNLHLGWSLLLSVH